MYWWESIASHSVSVTVQLVLDCHLVPRHIFQHHIVSQWLFNWYCTWPPFWFLKFETRVFPDHTNKDSSVDRRWSPKWRVHQAIDGDRRSGNWLAKWLVMITERETDWQSMYQNASLAQIVGAETRRSRANYVDGTCSGRPERQKLSSDSTGLSRQSGGCDNRNSTEESSDLGVLE